MVGAFLCVEKEMKINSFLRLLPSCSLKMVETFGNILKNINSGHSPSAKKVIKRAKTYNISAYFIRGEGAVLSTTKR